MAQTVIIPVPRGNNIGKTIKEHFSHYKTIKYLAIDIVRDTKNRTNVATVTWTLN